MKCKRFIYIFLGINRRLKIPAYQKEPYLAALFKL